MNDKAYNRCMRTARLACASVRRELGALNNVSPDAIEVLVRGKETLASYIEKIMKDGQNVSTVYRPRIQSLLHINSEVDLKGTIRASDFFVKSILMTRGARLRQKRFIDLTAAEMYLKQAYFYDKKNPYVQVVNSALEYAKNVVASVHGRAFLDSFDFNGEPCVLANEISVLKEQAFDSLYALGNIDHSIITAEQKYNKDYASRNDYFVQDTGSAASHKIPSVRDRVFTLDSLIIADLYRGAFAHIAAKNKVRRFVNLRARNRDIEICPPKNLTVKRQFATIDAMTMHRYIYDHYADEKDDNIVGRDAQVYYFRREVMMYRSMWGESASVSYKNGKLYFNNGTVIDVPQGVSPHEGLHRVNAAYGALFGFTADDATEDWLFNSVRQAYTTEGTAEYRLAMIDAKMKGKLK